MPVESHAHYFAWMYPYFEVIFYKLYPSSMSVLTSPKIYHLDLVIDPWNIIEVYYISEHLIKPSSFMYV